MQVLDLVGLLVLALAQKPEAALGKQTCEDKGWRLPLASERLRSFLSSARFFDVPFRWRLADDEADRLPDAARPCPFLQDVPEVLDDEGAGELVGNDERELPVGRRQGESAAKPGGVGRLGQPCTKMPRQVCRPSGAGSVRGASMLLVSKSLHARWH